MGQKILVLNPDNSRYNPLLKHLGEVTNDPISFILNPRAFKLVQFTGGEDVSPELYGDISPINYCMSGDGKRDKEEAKIFNLAMQNAIPMAGICRGIQFLNVMCGGKLIHHLDEHGSNQHEVETSSITTVLKSFTTNSLHHQMCIPPTNGYILSWSLEKRSKRYVGDKDKEINWPGPEIEAVFIPWYKVFGVQWHPEMMLSNSKACVYYELLLKDLLDMGMKEFKSKHVHGDSLKIVGLNE